MKVSVVTPLFAIAGVPLAQLRFAKALKARGHEVDLVIGNLDEEYKFPGAPGVNVINLKQRHVRGMVAPLCAYLRERQPDVVFSAEDHLNAIVLLSAILTRSTAKISCSSRVTPFDTYSEERFSKRWVLKQLMRSVMWRADALTCVSQDMVGQYRQVFHNPPHVCVYNIVDDAPSRARLQEPVTHPWIGHDDVPLVVAAGRLAPWKGFPDLIRAMKLVTQRRAARLLILGDGPQRAELEALIASLGLADVVRLEGYVENPLKYFSRARVFVLSSLVEGMPNVLVEAMMCGCTPVATDCPTGPRELLRGGALGHLVPMRDPAAMAEAIVEALASPMSPERLAEAVVPFQEKAVIDRHFAVLGITG